MDSISIFELIAQQPARMLITMKTWLEKARAHADARKVSPDTLLTRGLVFDQYPLVRQVQIACDTSKFAAQRLSGVNAPRFEDNETTLAQLLTRVDNTVAYLRTLTPEHFSGAGTKRVQYHWAEGTFTEGKDSVPRIDLPNIYFHVTTVYAILRANGVELGKRDYMGADLPLKPL